MNVLWITCSTIPCIDIALGRPVSPNGGNWLAGISKALLNENDDIELAFCFPAADHEEVKKNGAVDKIKYYPVTNIPNLSWYDDSNLVEFQKIILEFNPDVITVFGTEQTFQNAAIAMLNKLGQNEKIIIWIQGLVSIYWHHYNAGLSEKIISRKTPKEYITHKALTDQRRQFNLIGQKEIQSIRSVTHVIGRTDWDYFNVKRINEKVVYHKCNETLRDPFYEGKWSYRECRKHSIFVSQCTYPIKGFHKLLEIMPCLIKKYPDVHIYTTGKDLCHINGFLDKCRLSGYEVYLRSMIKQYNLEKHITFLGRLNAIQMREQYLKANVFVSASSIENSPNSMGEAMILGTPVVASDVGGVANLLDHENEGYVYNFDAVEMLEGYIARVFDRKQEFETVCYKARKHAEITHNRVINANKLNKIYKDIIECRYDLGKE